MKNGHWWWLFLFLANKKYNMTVFQVAYGQGKGALMAASNLNKGNVLNGFVWHLWFGYNESIIPRMYKMLSFIYETISDCDLFIRYSKDVLNTRI